MSPCRGGSRASTSSGTTGAARQLDGGGTAKSRWGWLRALEIRDPGWASLRRALRLTIVLPPLAAFAGTIIGTPAAVVFAVFGALALLGLTDFSGPTISRTRAYAGATAVGAALVLLGTLASANAWSAVAGTMLVAFTVQFLGILGGYVVAAQTAMLLAFVVAVSIPSHPGAAWAQVGGWTLAGVVSLAAGVLLWPRHARAQVRELAGEACRAVAAVLAGPEVPPAVRDQARARVEATRRAYGDAQLRPAGPARNDRTLVDLVVQLGRAQEFADRHATASPRRVMLREEQTLRRAVRQVMEASASVLGGQAARADLAALDRDRTLYREALDRWAGDRLRAGEDAGSVLDSLTASVAARLLAQATLALAVDARVLAGLTVDDVPSPLPHWRAPRAGPEPWVRRVRATLQTHWHPTTVWFRNSLRAALALGLAVLLTRVTRVEHSFWVVLGTLSVLRSNALATGRTAMLAIAGTTVGFLIAAAFTLAIGTSRVGVWIALPITAFLAAYVPTVVSFLVGQAAFTLFVVTLFDLLQPQGWELGLVRLENVALGIGVSLIVAVMLWPRGARGQLGSALAAQYRAEASCLDAAFGFLLGRRGRREVDASRRAATAEVDRAREAFEMFLAERGSRILPMLTWGRVAAASDDVLLAADALEAVGLLGYRTNGCEQCVDRVSGNVAEVVGLFTAFADQLQHGLVTPAAPTQTVASSRDAVVGCLRAWRGEPDSPLGPTAIALTAAWFWNGEILRVGGELAQPVAAVAAAARSPWYR